MNLYNLLVSGNDKAWERGESVVDARRYLEHTETAVAARLRSLDTNVVAELTTLPTLFAYETMVGAPARVGWLTSVEKRDQDIKVSFRFDPRLAPIPMSKLEALLWPLQIGDWELKRTHWAVKEVDLLDVLSKATVTIAAANAAKGEYNFARQTLLKACDILKTLGHTQLDRFLLELGVEGLNARREQGSRAKRATVLAEYVLGHPGERTAEGEQLALAIVREAARTEEAMPAAREDIDAATRIDFRAGLKRDGYAFISGSVVADLPEPPATPPYAAPEAPTSGATAYVSAKPSARTITFAPNVFQIPDSDPEHDLVAVMMPFSKEFDQVHAAIKAACTTNELRCLRADDIWEASTVIQDIFSLLFRAQVVVVDFTGKNPNVMYETGIAHTLGKHVIPIAQSLDDVPFDMRHHRTLKYLPNAQGMATLEAALATKFEQFASPAMRAALAAFDDDHGVSR